MDNKDWLILKLLYEKKNVTKTALSLYLTQPALTTRLHHIEKEFGVPIVIRERRGVSFTPEGEYLAKCADEMLIKLENIKETISNMKDEVSGTLKLAVSKYMMRHVFPVILKQFKELYPKIEFKVTTGLSRDIYNLIYNQDVHISFIRGDYKWLGLQDLLFEENICAVSKNKFELKDLPELPRIEYKTDNLFRALLDNWWSENYSKPPFISMEVDEVDTCKELVVNNLGYAIIQDNIINGIDNLYISKLKDKDGNTLTRKTWMFYHEHSLELNAVKAFVDFIKNFDFNVL